ncbi:MAG: PepSY domain-containing protein [Deltaproteobacteria bacterium]|nr:PepSY domain-containing protein [Deltaproteobacteria bacterium]MBW2691072.1 PepSY domain-containing protein [Deltaproteobacteria bacterium]
MSAKFFFIQVHKWAALAVGIQLFLWVAGGLVMSLSDIDEVHGELTTAAIEPKPLRWEHLVAVDSILEQVSAPIAEMALSTGFSGPQYRLTDTSGAVHQFDAQTGRPLRAINANQALAVATANYSGDGTGRAPIRVDQNFTEYRGRLPAWRVDFDDGAATTLYIAADNGEVVTRRNRIWRIYDFAWMLHIMDYREREDFNHPLLVSASVLALLAALSGIYLIVVVPWRNDILRFVGRK